MNKKYKERNYFSERTKELILERNELRETLYGRTNKNKKARALAFKDIQINCSKSVDLLCSSVKNPLALTFMVLTVGLGTYVTATTVTEAKFDHKFFTSMENDPTIPKEIMLRVQKHYYNNKK